MSDGIGQTPRRAFGVGESRELESAGDAAAELERRGFVVDNEFGARVHGRKETPEGVLRLIWSAIRWEPVWSAAVDNGRPSAGWTAQEAVNDLVCGMTEAAAMASKAGVFTTLDALAVYDRGRRLNRAFEGEGQRSPVSGRANAYVLGCIAWKQRVDKGEVGTEVDAERERLTEVWREMSDGEREGLMGALDRKEWAL